MDMKGPESVAVVPAAVVEFMRKFRYNPDLAWYLGFELEGFLLRDGKIVAEMPELRPRIIERGFTDWNGQRVNPEPIVDTEGFACQWEVRGGPYRTLPEFDHGCRWTVEQFVETVRHFGYDALFQEWGPPDVPLRITPKPRYLEIIGPRSAEWQRATCRATGVHVHVGLPDHATALRVYNWVVGFTETLCGMGDHSGGARLMAFSDVIAHKLAEPDYFKSWEHLYEVALKKGYATDLGKWWSFIRLTTYGTIEFRMFGSTSSSDEIVRYARKCLELCKVAAEQ